MTVTMMIMISIILMISVKIPSLDKPRDTYMEVHFLLRLPKGKTHTVAKDKDGDGNDDDSEYEYDGDKALIIG